MKEEKFWGINFFQILLSVRAYLSVFYFCRLNFCLFFIFRSRQAGIVSTVLSAVSLTPAKNLSAVTLTPVNSFLAYSKIAIGLLDNFNRKLPGGDLRNNLKSRKRVYSPDSRSERDEWRRDTRRTSYDRRDAGDNRSRRDSEGSFYQSNRDVRFRSPSGSNRDPVRSAFSTYPGDQTPRRQGCPRCGYCRDYQ